MQVGEVVDGRYRVEAAVRTGGMGAVYRASDIATREPIAVKVLEGPKGKLEQRFQREAELLRSLEHPGIVRYLGHGLAPSGEAYLAIEWLEGLSLKDRLDQGNLSIGETLTAMQTVAQALGVAHAQGVVHRDLKPSNLFFVGGRAEACKIIDFGIARDLRPGHELTTAKTMLGTPGYMAPEQARGDKAVDARADLFSLGAVMMRCMAGRGPFLGDSAMDLLVASMSDQPPRLRDLVPEAPGSLENLVGRLLSKHAEHRPASASAVAEELSRIAEEVRAGAQGAAPSARNDAAPVQPPAPSGVYSEGGTSQPATGAPASPPSSQLGPYAPPSGAPAPDPAAHRPRSGPSPIVIAILVSIALGAALGGALYALVGF